MVQAMTDVVRQLLEVVRATPRNNEPRLVLADYYEAQGSIQRAQFVRAQLERAALPRWDPQVVSMVLQERAVLQAHGRQWMSELPELSGVRWGRFERGLIGAVAFDSVESFAAHGATAAAVSGFGRAMLPWPQTGERSALAPLPGLTEITIVGPLRRPEDLEWFANSPVMETVDSLNLVESGMGPDALGYLLESGCAHRLRALRTPFHDFGNLGVDLLVQSPLPALRELDISVVTRVELRSEERDRPTMDVDAAMMLAEWPGLERLESLNVAGNEFGEAGAEALLSAPGIAGLKTLGIRSITAWREPEDLAILPAIAELPAGMALDELDVSENHVSEEGIEAMSEAPALRALKILKVDNVHPTFSPLLSAAWFDSIRILSARDCLDEEALLPLLRRAPRRMHTLVMASRHERSQIDNVPSKLTVVDPLPALLHLDVDDCPMDLEGLITLSEVESLPNLLSLRLRYDPDWSRVIMPAYSEIDAVGFGESRLGERLLSLEIGFPGVDRLPEPLPVAFGDGDYQGPLRFL